MSGMEEQACCSQTEFLFTLALVSNTRELKQTKNYKPQLFHPPFLFFCTV